MWLPGHVWQVRVSSERGFKGRGRLALMINFFLKLVVALKSLLQVVKDCFCSSSLPQKTQRHKAPSKDHSP